MAEWDDNDISKWHPELPSSLPSRAQQEQAWREHKLLIIGLIVGFLVAALLAHG